MNFSPLLIATCLMSAVLAGCGPSRLDDEHMQVGVSAPPLDEATLRAGFDPHDKRTVALVAWLKNKGVTLEYVKATDAAGWWKITEPRASDDYDVTFMIRSFPSGASEEQMREAIDVNLAYLLNAPARLAMSYGGLNGTHPEAKVPKSDDALPRVNGLPITKAVEVWFMDYKPAPPREGP